MEGSSDLALNTTSLSPYSNDEIRDLDNWLANRFQNNVSLSRVDCAPASNLLKPSSSLRQILNTAQSSGSSNDQILAQSKSKFLQVVGYHYDRLSMGGTSNFLTSTHIALAFSDAQLKSEQFCKNLCVKGHCVDSVSKENLDKLLEFVGNAQARIRGINDNNCFLYLERNKANELQKLADTVAEQYSILLQTPHPDEKCVINFYNSRQMRVDLKEMISKTLEGWRSIKCMVLSDREENINYNDDVDCSLITYMNRILSTNHERIEKFLNDSLERGYNTFKQKIERVFLDSPFLDDIGSSALGKPLDDYYDEFTQELNAIVQLQLDDSEQEPTKTKFSLAFKEKENELRRYGIDMYDVKYSKARKSLHAEAKDDMRNSVKRLQGKHRLNEVGKIYENCLLKALDEAYRKSMECGVLDMTDSDEENTAGVTGSPGTSSRCMSTSSQLNSTSGDNQNIKDNVIEEYKPDPNLKYDCDSGDTDIMPSPSQAKRFRKHKSSREKTKKDRPKKSTTEQ